MKNLCGIVLLGLFFCSCEQINTPELSVVIPSENTSVKELTDGESFKLEISTTMENQQKAWNSGSLDQFMIGYWKSDSLKFIGKSGLNYGWEQTLSNYQKSYPTADSMGVLQFNNISIELLDKNAALVVGKWTLFRDVLGDTLAGHYSLNWKLIQGKWVIIADHSS
jgi:hypothetical protein